MRGGLQLTAHKQAAAEAAIVSVAAPQELILPLDQHAGDALTACVGIGDRVLLGQTIAKSAETFGADLHASVSGVVIAVETRPSAHRQGKAGLSIVIANDGREQHQEYPRIDWQGLAPLALCEHIARGGIVGLGGAVFPTAKKLAAHGTQAIDCLILNGVECEPYITCDDRLMRERAALITLGARILLQATQAKQCVIAVENDKPEAFKALRAVPENTPDPRIVVRSIETTYPTGDEAQLIAIVTGREIPRGSLPVDLGVVCQNVGTAAAVAKWVEYGEPLISRIVTVTGAGVKNPGNVEARLGTSFADLIAASGGYSQDIAALIMGGSMMGVSLPHDRLPVVKATNCLIAATAADLHPALNEQSCIRCGDCMLVCPAGLLPQQLHAHVLNDNRIALEELGLRDCIECGCCDYVCPSQIPLASRFHAAKKI